MLGTVRERMKLLPIVASVALLTACGVFGPPRVSVPPAPIEGAPDWERLELFTFCGVSGLTFDGVHWEFIGGPLEARSHMVDGFSSAWDHGWVVRIGPDEARYVTSQGVLFSLRRGDVAEPDPSAEPEVCM